MAQPIVIIADSTMSERDLQRCEAACRAMAQATGQEVRVLLTEWSLPDVIQASLATQGMARVVQVVRPAATASAFG